MRFYKVENHQVYCCETCDVDDMGTLHFLVDANLEIDNHIDIVYSLGLDSDVFETKKVSFSEFAHYIDSKNIYEVYINGGDYSIVMTYGILWVYADSEERAKSIYAQLDMLDNEIEFDVVEKEPHWNPNVDKWFDSKKLNL